MNPQFDPKLRYAGKPLLRFLDADVLWVIGALSREEESLLVQMAPMLQQAWNRKELYWHELVAAELHFPTTMPTAIREKWEQNQAIAAANRVTLIPVDLAYTFVDQNFNQ